MAITLDTDCQFTSGRKVYSYKGKIIAIAEHKTARGYEMTYMGVMVNNFRLPEVAPTLEIADWLALAWAEYLKWVDD